MNHMGTPLKMNPCLRGHEIYNFCRPFLGHHITIFSLSDLCLGIEEKIFQNTNHAFSVYNLYDHTLAQESLFRGSCNLPFFVAPSLVIITINLICDFCLGIEKIFQEITHFHFMINGRALAQEPLTQGS